MSFVTLKRPDEAGLERFLQAQCALPVTYHGGLEARHPLVRVGAPAMRVVQTRFAGDSVRSLRRFIAQSFQP
jgi:hypothetical protein